MSNKSEHILNQLKDHLNSISEEEFKKEWDSLPEFDNKQTIDEYLENVIKFDDAKRE